MIAHSRSSLPGHLRLVLVRIIKPVEAEEHKTALVNIYGHKLFAYNLPTERLVKTMIIDNLFPQNIENSCSVC